MRYLTAVVRHASLTVAFLGLLAASALAQSFSSGSTGADGAFTPTCTPTPCTVAVALPASGVFNFTTITIPTNVTVTFARNAANTPAILLATGAVTISGTIDVSGSAGTALGRPGPGGPGGFEGGKGADGLSTILGGPGLGPGGGNASNGYAGAGGGGYGTSGSSGGVCPTCDPGILGTPGGGGPAYGAATLRPILGGSGGGGGGTTTIGYPPGGGGGGGGGALIIASNVSITLNSGSSLRAKGGIGSVGPGGGGGGSGGAIRLIAPTIAGTGEIHAEGGGGAQYFAGAGGSGRIRLEATAFPYTGSTTPTATTGLPQAVFPATGQPGLWIARVAGIDTPPTPSGSILAAPDILLPLGTTSPVEVLLTASNVPLGTVIQVTATPQSGTKTSALSSGLAGTLASSTATASLTISLSQNSVLTATATFPLVASASEGPVYAEGEEVTHVRVAAVLGEASSVTFLTRSGREILVR